MRLTKDKFKELWHFAVNSLFYVFRRKKIHVHCYVEVKRGRIVKSNWGDDLNVYLIELLTGRNVVVSNRSLFHILFNKRGYLCIGSILGFVGNKDSIAWGTGSLGYDQPILSEIPDRICSVRGPMTRELLESLGHSCPAKYGDPALLLSRYYKPIRKKKYRMGIVPHISQRGETFIKKFVEQNKDVVVIDLGNYSCWTDVIDQIVSCEFIVSSSLHGLIVADSYMIPNVWVKSPGFLAGGTFKFYDYLHSVNRGTCAPVEVSSADDLLKLYDSKVEYKASVDYQTIMDSCPFKKFLLPPLD